MTQLIKSIKCTHVLAQVSLGFYDAEGNLVGEATFPQVNGNVGAASLFHPHQEQLGSLIELCVQQAWEKLHAPASAATALGEPQGPGVGLPGLAAREGEHNPAADEIAWGGNHRHGSPTHS